MSNKNIQIDPADVKGPSNTFNEARTGRLIELTLAAPNCAILIRSPNGDIEDQFLFAFNQLGVIHQTMLGLGFFSVMDLSGNKRKYKIAEGQNDILFKWYSEEAFKRVNEEVKEEDELGKRLEDLKEEMGVSNLLEFKESEWREDQPGFKSAQKESFFFIAFAEDALYLLHEPPDEPHPLFSYPIKRLEYKDCSFALGGGSMIFNISFFLGALLRGESNGACRLLTKEGELLLVGTKEHVRALEQALVR